MAEQCGRCGNKLGFFERKGWDIDEVGIKKLLCANCLEKARLKYDPYLINKGYTRIVVSLQLDAAVLIATGLQTARDVPFPIICVVCGVPADHFGDSKKKTLSDSHDTHYGETTHSISVTVNICQRCNDLGLKVKDFFRLRFPGDLVFEAGNPEVALILAKTCKGYDNNSRPKLIKPNSKYWHPA